MITAVDTNVLLDVFGADEEYGPASRSALERASLEGSLIACDLVWAEVSAAFASREKAADALERAGIACVALSAQAALAAGEAWRAYRRRGGARARMVVDFLIGAHAKAQADRLLTRDRGFYRTYFKGLDLIDPAQRA